MKIELFTLLTKTLFWEDEMFRLSASSLYDQSTFYGKFYKDVKSAKKRVVIESPFITVKRATALLPAINSLRAKGVKVIVNTKPFNEHNAAYRNQAIEIVKVLQSMGVIVLMTRGHHRKIAIIDDTILYEGSLNILSQNDSCEIMRRTCNKALATEMLQFIGLRKWCK